MAAAAGGRRRARRAERRCEREGGGCVAAERERERRERERIGEDTEMKGGSRAGMTRRLGFSAPPAVDARGRGADGWDGRERRSDGRDNLGGCDNYCSGTRQSESVTGGDGFERNKK